MKLNIKNKLKEYWPYATVILAIVLPWFFNSGYLFFTDNVWGPNIRLDWTSAWFIFNLVLKALSFIFSISLLEKIFISGVLALILLGGRIFVKTILHYYSKSESSSRGLVFVLSLFALFNPFVYDRALYGQFGLLTAYGCMFFVLAYLLQVVRTLDLKYLYQAAIFTALTLMFAVHFIFLLAPFYIVFLIALLLKYREIKEPGQIKKLLLALLFSTAIVLIINANWLIALATQVSPLTNFVEQGISNQDLVAFQTIGKTPLETFSNVLLMSGFWGKEQFRYLDLTAVAGWQNNFLFLLPLILYGVYLSCRRQSSQAKFFSFGLIITFSIAVMLSVGIKAPVTREFSLFLYNHLPFYKGLREPQKWVAIIIPIYLFYLSLGAGRLQSFKFIASNRVVSAIVLAALISVSSLSLLWGFNRQVKPTLYPADWYQVDAYIRSQDQCQHTTLFLPWHLYMSFNWIGNIVASPAYAFFSCPTITGTNMEFNGIYDNSQNPQGQQVEAWLGSNGTQAQILRNLSVRYVIIAKEVDWQSYDWIQKLSYLHLIKTTSTLLVYEIKP